MIAVLNVVGNFSDKLMEKVLSPLPQEAGWEGSRFKTIAKADFI